MEERNEYTLVTVAVIAYNSSRFILETLESIKAQTYHNIELIVADDGSKDNTVEICQDWIEKEGGCFVDAKVITTPKNTGTAGNANRAWKASKGEWIKYIAGDDLLEESAIKAYVEFVGDDIKLCFADAIHFIGNLDEHNYTYKKVALQELVFGNNATAERQYAILKKQLIGNGPTCFMKRELLEEIDGFDERFPLMDDYPMLLRISRVGYKFYVMPKATIYYRNHDDSVSHKSSKEALFEDNLVRCIKDYKFQYKREHLNIVWRGFLNYTLFIGNMVIKFGNNRKNIISFLFYGLYLLTDPFIWYSRVCNLVDKLMIKYKKN